MFYLLLTLLAAASAAAPRTIESVIFRTTNGEGLQGYLQTSDTQKKTIYCEAAPTDASTYEIKVHNREVILRMFYLCFIFLFL